MTDEQLDRLVRDADPYRPEVIGHLDGAAQHLLEEIMSVPVLERVAEPPGRRPRARRGMLSGLAGAGIAAALITGFVAVSVLNGDRPQARQASPAPSSTVTGAAYSAMVLKAAEQ